MNKNIILISISVISLLLFLVPFLLPENVQGKISTGLDYISVAASIATLALALFLYNKFGIERSLLDKQTKEVFSLLEKLNKIVIFMNGHKLFLRYNPAEPYDETYERFYHKKLLFSLKYLESLEPIWNFSENIFMPKSIAKKIKATEIYSVSDLKNGVKADELAVTATIGLDESDKFGLANQKEICFLDFANLWSDLRVEVEDWIDKNSSIKSNLNLK